MKVLFVKDQNKISLRRNQEIYGLSHKMSCGVINGVPVSVR